MRSFMFLMFLFCLFLPPAIGQSQDYGRLLESADKSLMDRNFNRAVKQYSQCIDLQPEDYRPFYRRGRAYYYSGNNRRALADFKRSIALNPSHTEAYNYIIAILNKSGEEDKADIWQTLSEEAEEGKTPDFARFNIVLPVISAEEASIDPDQDFDQLLEAADKHLLDFYES